MFRYSSSSPAASSLIMSRQKRHTIRFNLLLTPEQKVAWEAKAEAAGLKLSELIRRAVEKLQVKSVPKVNWQVHWELGKIGNNINQIAKAQNMAIKAGLTPPPIDSIPFKQLENLLSKMQLQLILGVELEEEPEGQEEELDDWQDS